jgi:hypothetical protein
MSSLRSLSSRTLLAAALVGAALSLPAAAQVAAPGLKPGDTWTYRGIDNYNRLPTGSWTREVTGTAAGGIRVAVRSGDGSFEDVYRVPGELASGVLNERASGSMEPALQLMPFPLAEGKSWSQKVVRTDPFTKERREMLVTGRVRGWETVKVPAGEFKALKVERTMYLGDYDSFRGITQRTETEWYVPELRGAAKLVVFEEFCERRYGCPMGTHMPGVRATYELTSYKGG